MSFAKGITQRLPAPGGIQISDEIRDVIMTAEYSQRWTHAYTYSGHPTCCAVGLKNLEILEREGLLNGPNNAAGSCWPGCNRCENRLRWAMCAAWG